MKLYCSCILYCDKISVWTQKTHILHFSETENKTLFFWSTEAAAGDGGCFLHIKLILMKNLHTHILNCCSLRWIKLFLYSDVQTPALMEPRTTWWDWGGEEFNLELCFCCLWWWWGGEVFISLSIKRNPTVHIVWKYHHWLCLWFFFFSWRISSLILTLLFLHCLLLFISCLTQLLTVLAISSPSSILFFLMKILSFISFIAKH